MLADKLDAYKGKGKVYVEDNIREIQELFKEEESKKEGGHIKEQEVILVKPYEMSKSSSLMTSTMSFITDEVENLLMSRLLTMDLNFIFISYFISFPFLFLFFSFIFLFLEQLGLGVISHAVTSVTT